MPSAYVNQAVFLLRRPHVFQILRAIGRNRRQVGGIVEAVSRAAARADSDGDAHEENISKFSIFFEKKTELRDVRQGIRMG